jgi:serine O-acetyltransferase
MFENIRADYALHRPLRNRALWALVVYRFGRWSMERRFGPWRWLTSKVYGFVNILSEIVTGVIMGREVRIGKGFHIIHPERVRIHPAVVIGDRVGVMHGVTIGTNMDPGVPVIGNDVFIGANATIIGKIKVHDGARIAANSLVVSNVPPGTVAIGVPAKIMRLPATRHASRRDEHGLPGNFAIETPRLAPRDGTPQARPPADPAARRETP